MNPTSLKKNILSMAVLLVVALLSSLPVKAVPYASAVKCSGGTVSFILNEDANSVKVAFNNGSSTNDLGAMLKGPHSFSLGAATNFQIIVKKDAPSGWFQISSDTNKFNQFYSARGLAVNKNPGNAAVFGRVYVSNPLAGTTSVPGSRDVGKGLYVLNADGSDALGRFNIPSNAGVTNDNTTGNPIGGDSPWRIEVGPDNNVYVCDYSTNAGGLWRTDPDVLTNVLVLNGRGKNAAPKIHATIGSVHVRGSQETGDLRIWAHDGNWTNSSTLFNAAFRWDIGGTALPFNTAPTQVCDKRIGVAHLQQDIDVNGDGTRIYDSINRSGGTDVDSIRVFDTTAGGTTMVWGSLAAGGSPDPLRQVRGIKLSPDSSKLAAIRDDNTVFVITLDANGYPDLANYYTMPTYPANQSVGRDVCWDAAGNLYTISSGGEALRVFSPGGKTTAITGADASGKNGSFNVTTDPNPDPYIVYHPLSDQKIGLGTTNITVSVGALARGTGTLTYQWYHDGTPISGANDTNYNIFTAAVGPGIAATDAGSYWVVCTGDAGSVTSRVAILTVASNPLIIGSPQSQVANTNAATFTVSAIGSATLSYQWYANGTLVSGVTGNSFTKSGLTLADNGTTVYAVVANTYGSVTSSVATLTVSAPVFVVQPQSAAVSAGTTNILTGFCDGVLQPTYQWYYNGAAQSGQTSWAFARNNFQNSTMAGFYQLVASNIFGVSTSALATLTSVETPPIITKQPVGVSTNAGSNAVFTVTTVGSDPKAYQWQLNGTNIMGQTTSSLTRNAQRETAGDYTVIITNLFGAVTSSVATLTVADISPPTLTLGFMARTVPAGSNVTFTVTAVGNDPKVFQWQFNNADIPGATASSYTLTNAQVANTGPYVVFGGNVVNGTTNMTSTANADLTVTNTPIRIISQPANKTTGTGQDATFAVQTWGDDPRGYQWYSNSVLIAGATSNSFTVVNPQLTDDNKTLFCVAANNSSGTDYSVTSSVVTLRVTNRAPTIVVQPTNLVTTVGGSATFTVVAQGDTPTLAYQWRNGTNNITGATGSSLTFNNAQMSDAGTNYNVVVSSSAGSATSQFAQLAVRGSSTPGSGIGLLGQYFANQYLANVVSSNISILDPPTLTRVDPNVDFSWASGVAPDPSIPENYFIVRWTGQVQPLYSQLYTFYTKSDDGVRLWVNNQLVIDHWQSGASQNYSAIISNAFVAGQKYDVRLEYVEITAGAEAHLLWSSDSQIKEPIATSQLYTNSGPYIFGISPTSRVMNVGTSASSVFSVYAGGDGPLKYQWRRNGANISGATGSSLALNNAQLSDAGTYTVVVTNSLGATTNLFDVVLTVPGSLVPGTGTGLTADYINSPYTTNLWQTNPWLLTNAPALTRTDPTVDFDWGNGSPDFSVAANYFVGRWTGKVQAQLSEPYTFSILSDDGARLWVDGQLLIDSWGATGSTNVVRVGTTAYALTAGQAYDIRLEVFEQTGAAQSHLLWSAPNMPLQVIPTSQLYPNSGPYVITQTTNQAALAGSTVTFTVWAGGPGTLAYQWKKNGSNIGGATTSVLTLPNVQSTDEASYTVTVSNAYGASSSTNATLTVNSPPNITGQPQSANVNIGDAVTFSVAATGSAPLTYQWRFNTTNVINGATGSSYNIPSVQSTDVGSYSVVVSNAFGTATSADAVLTIGAVSGPLFGQPVMDGANVVLNWSAIGGRTYRLQTKPDLNATNWTDVTPDILATGSTVTVTNSAAGTQKYYRAILLP